MAVKIAVALVLCDPSAWWYEPVCGVVGLFVCGGFLGSRWHSAPLMAPSQSSDGRPKRGQEADGGVAVVVMVVRWSGCCGKCRQVRACRRERDAELSC